ncbi:MAG: sulfatase-like hydrolase/transferase [Acidobacteria bacterium]|nr:sulfatase-like hydrolase/transferase [Acidobacteriota bacterium]
MTRPPCPFWLALSFLVSVMGVGAAAWSPQSQATGGVRPNILFLFADDMRADTIAAHGNPHISTPTLDGIARRGFSFRRAYVFGGDSGAVCVASRAMLMSGRTLFHVNTSTLADVPLLPEVFGKAGYTTFATGKWHNGEASWLRAFKRGRSVMFGGMSNHAAVPVKDLGPDGQLTPVRTETTFSSELFADSAIAFLNEYRESAPFFAYVAFTAPHDPRQPPPAFSQPYYDTLPPLPPDFLPQFPFDNGGMTGAMRDENLTAWPRPERDVRAQLAEYYGMVTHLDAQIRRVLDALDTSGHARNTIIVFAADNGLALGSHGLLGKQSVFEHSTRVPLVIAGPGVPAGRSSEALSYLYDLFPTLAEAAGIATPDGLDGTSLLPVVQQRQERVRDSLFTVYTKTQRAVQDGRWKLVAYPVPGYLQLFDLRTDPFEMTNLIDRPDSAAHVARLQTLMREWQSRQGDTVPVPATSTPPPPIDLTGTPRKPDQWQPDWIVKKYFDK